jgi:hypothetical protein
MRQWRFLGLAGPLGGCAANHHLIFVNRTTGEMGSSEVQASEEAEATFKSRYQARRVLFQLAGVVGLVSERKTDHRMLGLHTVWLPMGP